MIAKCTVSNSRNQRRKTYLGNLRAIILSGVGGVKEVGTVQAKNQRRPKGAAIANTTGWTSSSLSPLLKLFLSVLELTADSASSRQPFEIH